MPYLTPVAIETRLNALATTYSAICTRHACSHPSHNGTTVSYLRITNGAGAGRPKVLVIAGVHAREWAPPDAVLSFAHKLLNAYSTSSPIIFPAFRDSVSAPAISFPRFRLPFPDVRRIVERLNLFILPCVNPDGRAFSMSAAVNADWRKNRRPNANPACIGVDINRNFDIAWDFDVYYSVAAAATVASSKDPCDPQVYIGSSPESEPETQNVRDLINSEQITFFVDVHSYSRKILYPWGVDTNQTIDSTQSFQNVAHNRNPAVAGSGRDGTTGNVYKEFFPNNAPLRLLAKHELIGNRMKDRILGSAGPGPIARSRSTYTVEPSLDLYPATGVSDDYAFSRQLINPALAPIFAFTIECGSSSDGEGGFQPDYTTKYPKIEREVHAALSGLLSYAAAWHRP